MRWDFANASAPTEVYAGFWRRVAAFAVDQLICIVAVSILISARRTWGTGVPFRPWPLIWVLCLWLYYALFESSSFQATPGKQALRIKVTDEAGQRIGFGRASGRYFAKILSSMCFAIGYVMVAFTRRRQGLHDLIAGTLVIRQGVDPARLVNADRARRMSGGAIALIIIAALCFGPVGLGVLAAIAIPAYRTYTIRSQIDEGLTLAQSYQQAVGRAVSERQKVTQISSATLQLSKPTARYVSDIEVEAGVVVIEYGQNADRAIRGKLLLLVPAYAADGSLLWICGTAAVPVGVQLTSTRLSQYNTVPAQYLPSRCHY